MKLFRFMFLFLIISSCALFNSEERIRLKNDKQLLAEDDNLNEIEETLIFKCDQNRDTIIRNKDLLNLKKPLLQCIADKNFYDKDYDATDMIYILKNIHYGKWKFLFPENKKFRGLQLFNFFIEKSSDFNTLVTVMDGDTYPRSRDYLKHAKRMIFSYNGFESFDKYLSWYENSNSSRKEYSMEWVYRVTELDYEQYQVEKAKYHYKIMLYAIENEHIKLKKHGE